jgi:hypothetical protein
MSKIFKITIISFLILTVIGIKSYAADESWGENSDVFQKGFEDQKAVSDKKMTDTIKMLKERALSSKQRRIKKDVKPLSPSYDQTHLRNFTDTESQEDELNNSLTVMIPMQSYSEDGTVISPGFYKLSCRKISENKYVLDLSQGTNIVVTVEANQTQQDLEQESITFCNAKILEKGRIRLMYGNLDLNLVGYIYYDTK